ncbi:MAG TPA: general stress protein [Silvibacterium sp.]|nr:general stress protein [Silvibacterium sp.]
METTDTVIAVFTDHQAADAAVKKLTEAGFEMKNLSVVGKGYHTEEKVVGFTTLAIG